MMKNKILIIEGEKQTSLILQDFLTESGEEVLISRNDAKAFKDLKQAKPDTIIVDVDISKIKGYQRILRIRKKCSLPIFVLADNISSPDELREISNLKINGIFEKPIDLDQLLARIRLYRRAEEPGALFAAIEKETADKLYLQKQLETVNVHLKQIAARDVLTNLYNKRYLEERLLDEFGRAKRYLLPLSLAMIDLDFFKTINEIYGHPYGDKILKEFGVFLGKATRVSDVSARYGGEEFVVLLPNTPLAGAVKFGQNLSQSLSEKIFDKSANNIKLKASIGVSAYPEQEAVDESALLKQADTALCEAKRAGGNRCVAYRTGAEKEFRLLMGEGGEKEADEIKEKIYQLANRVNRAVTEAICGFAKSVKAKDQYSSERIEGAIALVGLIADDLKLPGEKRAQLEQAALLHDLGKVGIENRILRKKGKLTKKEVDIIRRHPVIGAEILRPIHFLKDVIAMVLYHHERYDGTGYPSGLKKEEIPLEARIIAVIDVYQALRSDRPYRKAYSKKEALDIILEGSGTQFDPKIVKSLLKKERGIVKP